MSSETGTAGSSLPDAYYRRLFSLIPARSLKSTLNELAAVWCEATAADAACIAVVRSGIPGLAASIFQSSQNESEHFFHDTVTLLKESSLWEQSRSIFEQGRAFQEISCAPAQCFSIPCDQMEIAEVYLFSSIRFAEDLPLISQLLNLSHRLLSQASEQQILRQTGSAIGGDGQSGFDQDENAGQMVLPRTDKLEAMAEFAAGAGHEINNPVATIVGRVQMLLKGETDPQRRQSLSTIGGQAYRVRDMIGDAMLFARPPAPRPVSLALQETVQEVLTNLQDDISATGVHVTVEIPDLHHIWADLIQWKVVLSNLILNSLNVLESGGHIRIISEEKMTGRIRFMHIRVIDDGPGLTVQEQEHLFDPFFSARQAGRGLGFGLSKCWRIIQLHGGTIEAEINADKGMTFHLFWPIEDPEESEVN